MKTSKLTKAALIAITLAIGLSATQISTATTVTRHKVVHPAAAAHAGGPFNPVTRTEK